MLNGAASVEILVVLVVKVDTGEMVLFPTTGVTVFFVSSRHIWTFICLTLFYDLDIKTFASNIASGTVETGAFKRSFAAFFTLLLATDFFLPILVML